MRPHFLSIKGFGPYLNVEISHNDFEKIARSNIFLISGKIGAGKTTIFDAILYALFGKLSMEERMAKDMVSQFLSTSSKSIIPEVSLEFSFQGKLYKITRKPAFKGIPERASLWIEGKIYSSKCREINAFMENLFGLKADQFKKVFMIPQGEYRKILLSKGEERKKLLEHIFETSFFSNFEEFIKERLKTLEKELQFLSKEEERILNLCETKSAEELKNKIQDFSEKQLKIKREIEHLFEEKRKKERLLKEVSALEELLIEKEKRKKALNLLFSKKEEIAQKEKRIEFLEKVKDYFPYYENVKNQWKKLRILVKEKKNLSQRIEGLKKEILEIEKNLQTLEKKKNEIEEKRESLSYFEKILELIKEKEEKKIFIDKWNKEIQKLERALECLRTSFQIFENLEGESKNFLDSFYALEEEKKILEEQIKIVEIFLEKRKIEKELPEIEKKLSELKEKKEKLLKKEEEIKIKTYLKSLTKKLKKGDKCPICGNILKKDFKSSPFLFDLSKKIEKDIITLEKEIERIQKEFHFLLSKKELIEQTLAEIREKEGYKKFFEDLKNSNLNTFLNELISKKEDLRKEFEKSFIKFIHFWEDSIQNLKRKEFAPFLESWKELNPEDFKIQEKLKSSLREIIKICEENRKKIQKDQEKLEESLRERREKLKILEGELLSIKSNFEKFVKNFLTIDWSKKLNSQELKREIENKMNLFKKEIANWEEEKSFYENSFKTKLKERSEIEGRLKEILQEIDRTLKDYKTNFARAYFLVKNGEIKALKDFEKFKPYLKEILILKNEIKEYYENLASLQNLLNTLEKKEKTLSSSLFAILKNLYPEYQNLSTKELISKIGFFSEEVKKKEEKISALNREIGFLEERISLFKKELEVLIKTQKEKKEKEKEFSQIKMLYDIISGQNPKRVSFHSYVLSFFLHLVLKQANLYFCRFSEGRFKFVEENIFSKRFLLEVFDNYTGQKREVKTLSGGESFLATLSLALAISDTVLRYFHGRKIDCLFIDEGFGNLDSATLEKVIQTIFEIAVKTKRIIGIISHVEELKKSFPIVLEVEKDVLNGSKIRIKQNW